jgi:thermitase
MKKGFLIALVLCSKSLYAQVNELLYVEKDSQKKVKDSSFPIKKYKHSQKSSETLEEVRQRMLKSGKYKYVEYNSIEHQDMVLEPKQNLKSNGQAWHLDNIQAEEALGLIKNPHDVTVAVCDSGYEEEHDDLRGGSIPGYSLVDQSYDTSPNTHHGTMVSGIIVGKPNKEIETSGIAPVVKVMPLKITTTKGSTTLSRIVDCIKHGVDNGAKVVNVSFTGVNNQSIDEVGRYAKANGTLLVYSAGNQGRNRGSWPDHKNVLIVGGTQKGNARWNCNGWWGMKKCGSNYGDFVDIVAPARDVFTTRAHVTFGGDLYSSPNGTSFSAPIVSAVAALIYSVNPDFTPEEVENILTASATDLGNEYVFGSGLVNAKRAVSLALDLSK